MARMLNMAITFLLVVRFSSINLENFQNLSTVVLNSPAVVLNSPAVVFNSTAFDKNKRGGYSCLSPGYPVIIFDIHGKVQTEHPAYILLHVKTI